MTAKEIKALRESREMTQHEFAVKVGVSQATVAYWESGKRTPTGTAQIVLQMIAEKRR